MKQIAWLTDIHLEFLKPEELHTFVDKLVHSMPDIVLIGGDTDIAINFASFFQYLEEQLKRPIYFVLGNHDYYRGSLTQVRATAQKLSRSAQWLHWLPIEGIVRLSETTALMGHGSWADGRLGNGAAAQVELNDYYLIKELTGLSTQQRFLRLARLGDEAAAHFEKFLPQAWAQFQNVLMLMHVPSFRDACWHEGKISDDEYLPHFACKAVGDVLVDVMKKYPQCKLTVLCGHTHSKYSTESLCKNWQRTVWSSTFAGNVNH